jgi:Flp pilus assembly protein TadG
VIRRCMHQRGQVAIEFLFTVLFVMFFVLGFLELVMLMFSYNVVADGAKEGVRFAIVHGTLSTSCNGPGDPKDATITCDNTKAGVKTAVTTYANHSGQSITNGQITVTYSNPNGGSACSTPGCAVEVQVAHLYRPFFGLGWPTVTMHATSEGVVTF